MKRLLACAVLIAALQPGLLWAGPTLKVGYYQSGERYQPLIIAIYKEAGLVPEFVALPLERSLRSVDNGEIDADMGRATGSLAAYPNAIESAEPIVDMQLQVLVRKDFSPTKLAVADLKTYNLGYLRGAKMAENFISAQGLKASAANSMDSILAMLAAGRVDVVLNSSLAPLSDYPQYADRLTTLPLPLQTVRVVHVMNKKWIDYMPKVNAAIKTLRANGRLAKLLRESAN